MRVILPHGRSFHRGFPAFGGLGTVATKLVISTQPSASPSTGVAFAQQPVIQLQDVSSSPVLQSGVTVTATRSAGSDTLGGTLTAVTNNSGLATFTDLMFTGTAGSDAITFSASGLTPATSNPINPAAGDAEPTFNAGSQTLILNDALQHASFPAAVAAGWDGVHRDGSLGDHVIYDGTIQDTSFCATGANLAGVADSPTGSGTCMGVEFTGFNTDGPVDQPQEARTWHRRFSDVLLGKPGHAIYLSFYHKIVAGAGHTLDGLAESGGSSPDICKVKWLELWPQVGTGGSRAQFNTSSSTNVNDVPNTGCGGTGTMWAADGNGTGGGDGPTAHCGQVRAPFAYQGRSGWHKTTYKYMTQTAPGARDGVMMMWYDGVLIVANAAPYLNVTVPGGLGTDFFNGNVPQKWCLAGDIDNIFTDDYIISLTLAGVSTSGFWPYKILYGGPFMVWRD